MPPLRPGARPAPPSTSPPREPFPPLSDVEETLFDTAIRLDCALREFAAQGGAVDISFFTESIIEELVSCSIPQDSNADLQWAERNQALLRRLKPSGPPNHSIPWRDNHSGWQRWRRA